MEAIKLYGHPTECNITPSWPFKQPGGGCTILDQFIFRHIAVRWYRPRIRKTSLASLCIFCMQFSQDLLVTGLTAGNAIQISAGGSTDDHALSGKCAPNIVQITFVLTSSRNDTFGLHFVSFCGWGSVCCAVLDIQTVFYDRLYGCVFYRISQSIYILHSNILSV